VISRCGSALGLVDPGAVHTGDSHDSAVWSAGDPRRRVEILPPPAVASSQTRSGARVQRLPQQAPRPSPNWARLVAALEPFTGSQPCYFYWTLWPPDWDDVGNPHVYRGRLIDLPGSLNRKDTQRNRTSPNYWWAEDRTWIVCYDDDLWFTVIGGSSEQVGTLLADPTLDTIEVFASTRIDTGADTTNPSSRGYLGGP
jgi:hypothetical protein